MGIDYSEKILLTGAGFTHNFGGPLATEMWAWIFNSKFIQSERSLRELMLKDFDFESVYYKVMEGKYKADQKKAMQEAVLTAFDRLDKIIREYNDNEQSSVNLSLVRENLLNRFYQQGKRCFIFTLNQDLFLERKYSEGHRPYLPGIKQNQTWFTPSCREVMQRTYHYPDLPTSDQLNEIKENELHNRNFFYIKLHGSYTWISSQGSDLLVIGRGKTAKIKNEPLLKWYFELFQEVLFKPNRKILIIGYGFRDDHINEVLSEAISRYGLEIYIVSPVSPEKFKNNLIRTSRYKIWLGLTGYFPFTLERMYNRSGLTQVGRSLTEHFFEE